MSSHSSSGTLFICNLNESNSPQKTLLKPVLNATNTPTQDSTCFQIKDHAYLLTHCCIFRALRCPGFFLSTIRVSVFSNPATPRERPSRLPFCNTIAYPGSKLATAFANANRTASAWPVIPPPSTFAITSNRRNASVTASGAST